MVKTRKRKKHSLFLKDYLLISVLLIIVIAFLVFLPQFPQKKEVVFMQDLDLISTQNQEYLWTLSNAPSSYRLASVKISGKIINDGNVKVYLKNGERKFLIMGGQLPPTGITGKFLETDENVKDFEEMCLETCDLTEENLSEDSYEIITEIPEGSVLEIDDIEYSIIVENEAETASIEELINELKRISRSK